MLCDIQVGAFVDVELMAMREVLYDNEIYQPGARFFIRGQQETFIVHSVHIKSMEDAKALVNRRWGEIQEEIVEFLKSEEAGNDFYDIGVEVVGVAEADFEKWEWELYLEGESAVEETDIVHVMPKPKR